MMPGQARDETAKRLLQTPENFASLPKRAEFDRVLCMWRFPSFSADTSWSVFRTRGRAVQVASGAAPPNEQPYVVRRLEHDANRGYPANVDDPHIFGSEGLLSAIDFDSLFSRFESLRLPVFKRYPSAGIDGIQYGVQTGTLWGGSRLTWWSHQQEDWAPLFDLFEEAVQLLEQCLPASSLRAYGA